MNIHKTVVNNMLIKEFMNDTMAHLVRAGDFNFHLDWNKLMAVVDKIEKLGYGMEINPSTVLVYDMDKATFKSRFDSLVIPIVYNVDIKINTIWWAVVYFINWYNKEKK